MEESSASGQGLCGNGRLDKNEECDADYEGDKCCNENSEFMVKTKGQTQFRSNMRLMWIFVGFFFGSVILVLLCFFCYIKCRRKQPPAEQYAGSNMTSPGPRYDIDPPRYTPTAEGGHHTLKPSEGPLPPAYSDIIDAAEGSLPSQDTPGHSTEQPSIVSQGNSEGTGTQPQGAASPVGGSEEQRRTVTRDSDGRKLEKDTPTHDKAGLIDNEVENSDE